MDRAEDRSNGGYNSGRRVPRLHDTNRRDTAPSCRASEPVRCSHAVPMGRAATAGGSSATREFVGAVALLSLIQGAPTPPAVRVMAGRQLHGSWTQLKPAVLARISTDERSANPTVAAHAGPATRGERRIAMPHGGERCSAERACASRRSRRPSHTASSNSSRASLTS
jgi:hypothetical protein